MNLALFIGLPLCQQGGVEVLVRALIWEFTEARIFVVSEDMTLKDLRGLGLEQVAGHFHVSSGTMPGGWLLDLDAWLRANDVNLCHFHLTGTYGWCAGSWRTRHNPMVFLAKRGFTVVSTCHQAFDPVKAFRGQRSYLRNCLGLARKWPGKLRQLHAVRWEACVSDHDLETTLRHYRLVGRKLRRIYHSQIDSNELADFPVKDAPIILNVAMVAYRKGQHILARAFARIAPEHPEWKLVLAGPLAEKSCVEEIRRIAETQGITDRLILIGPVSDPRPLLAGCGIYVQPSLLEGLGLSLQEAMAFGKPCIGSATGGIPELIDSPAVGLLFPAGDVSALADQLTRLITDTAARQTLGAAAQSSILRRGMTRQAMASTYRSLYREAIGS